MYQKGTCWHFKVYDKDKRHYLLLRAKRISYTYENYRYLQNLGRDILYQFFYILYVQGIILNGQDNILYIEGNILNGQCNTTEALEGHFYLLLITYYLILTTYYLLLITYYLLLITYYLLLITYHIIYHPYNGGKPHCTFPVITVAVVVVVVVVVAVNV